MVIRIVRFSLGAGKLDAAKSIFADILPQVSAQPGCGGVTSFGDVDSGNYGMLVLWESAQASEAGKAIIGPQLSKHLADNNASNNPFSTELFEVFE